MTTFNSVFVLDTTQKPLTPCSPARARALLRDGKAAVWRRVPFTLILKAALPDAVIKPMTIKIDPGSEQTGFALVERMAGCCLPLNWSIVVRPLKPLWVRVVLYVAIEKMARLGVRVDFNQGLDCRMIDDGVARLLGKLWN